MTRVAQRQRAGRDDLCGKGAFDATEQEAVGLGNFAGKKVKGFAVPDRDTLEIVFDDGSVLDITIDRDEDELVVDVIDKPALDAQQEKSEIAELDRMLRQ